MKTNSKQSLSALPDDPDSSRGPSSQPKSGTVLRSEIIAQADEEPTEKFPQELARVILLDSLREFCAAWPDQPHPALSGKTPRQIAATGDGLGPLVKLIGEMERQAQGTPVAEAWDFARLRFELGLAPVSSVSATKVR